MIRAFLSVIFMFIVSTAHADDYQVIKYSSETKSNEEYFFLYGTSAGNYIVRSWQFSMNESWNGEGEPNLSIGKAIEKTFEYFDRSRSELGVKEVLLRPAFSQKGTAVWFYHVTLTPLPYKMGAKRYEVVVLTSGELVLPYKPTN